LTSNKRFAVSAVFLAFLLSANAYPARAQETAPQRSQDAADSASSSATSAALADLADVATPASSPAEPAVAASAVTPSPAPATPAASAASESDWHLSVSPYLWFPGVHGIVGANDIAVNVSASPGDLLSHFRFGLMGMVDPSYKRFVMPLDVVWVRLGDDRPLPNTPNSDVANIKGGEFILSQKFGYRVINSDKVKIDALAGFRYWHFSQNLNFTTNTLNFSASQNWVDPVVGGRILGNLTPKISILIGGDVGGWNTGSQLDYQIAGVLGYRIKPNVALEVGYRYLDVNYRNGGSIIDMATSGALIGATIQLK
jgi:hypothetical protein